MRLDVCVKCYPPWGMEFLCDIMYVVDEWLPLSASLTGISVRLRCANRVYF